MEARHGGRTVNAPNTANVFSTYYDNLNRLIRVMQSGPTGAVAPKQVYFSWDGLDRMTGMTRGEYHAEIGWKKVMDDPYTYDKAGRLTHLRHNRYGTILADYYWSYDQASRPTEFESATDGTVTYSYDDTSQLLSADYDYQTDESYSYDDNGNRTNTGYVRGDNNQLLCDGTYRYGYDGEGNRTVRYVDADSSGTLNSGDTDITEYAWDYRNRLVTVTNRATYGGAATQAVDYIYDINNRLVGRLLDPDGAGEDPVTEEYYVYDGDQILLRFDGPEISDLKSRYLWAPTVDLLLSDEKLTSPTTPGDLYWAIGDNLNTIRDIAKFDPQTQTTSVVNHRVFDGFGNLTDESDPNYTVIFGFTGRLYEICTGLQYNSARWYDPRTGRWTSEDPIGFGAGDANLGRYVGNRPTYATDPRGTDDDFPVTLNPMTWAPFRWAICYSTGLYRAQDRAKEVEAERQAAMPNRIPRAGDIPTALTGAPQTVAQWTAQSQINQFIRERTLDGALAVAGVVIHLSGPYRSIRVERTAEYGPHMHIQPARGAEAYHDFRTYEEAISKLPGSLRDNPRIIAAIRKALGM